VRRIVPCVLVVLSWASFAVAQDEPPALPAPAEDFIGRAAPATPAGRAKLSEHVRAGLEVFAQYAFRNTGAPDGSRSWFHAFDLPRAHASISGENDLFSARLLLEGVRSTEDGALVGVARDSIVLRLREAWGQVAPWPWLEVRGGLVPTLTMNELDGTWMLRVIAPSGLESAGLASPADLGLTLRAQLPARYGWAGVGAYNGEGYASRELNRGKNLEAAAVVHPLPDGAALPLGVFVSYVLGSRGAELARANRLTAALLWQGDRMRGGVSFTYAWGVELTSDQRAAVGDAFVRVEPVERLLVGLRGSLWVRDTQAPAADQILTVHGSVGWRFADPFELHTAVTRSSPTSAAHAASPGAEHWEARLAARVVF
jgi:hypothetical protein